MKAFGHFHGIGKFQDVLHRITPGTKHKDQRGADGTGFEGVGQIEGRGFDEFGVQLSGDEQLHRFGDFVRPQSAKNQQFTEREQVVPRIRKRRCLWGGAVKQFLPLANVCTDLMQRENAQH